MPEVDIAGTTWLVLGLRAALVLAVGLLLARLAANGVSRLTRNFGDDQLRLNVRRAVFWGLSLLVLAAALHQLGFQLGVLLGAAGILSVALGFASQTSASNVISGLFLLGERPFRVGDVIDVGGTTGEVLSIDLLSVKLRTFENLFVRIPNETIIKSTLRNMSRFPIRRLDIQIVVEFGTDLEQVEAAFKAACEVDPVALVDPPPIMIAQGFNDNGIQVQLSVWGPRTEFLALRNSIHRGVAAEFDAAGIRFALPKRVLQERAIETVRERLSPDDVAS